MNLQTPFVQERLDAADKVSLGNGPNRAVARDRASASDRDSDWRSALHAEKIEHRAAYASVVNYKLRLAAQFRMANLADDVSDDGGVSRAKRQTLQEPDLENRLCAAVLFKATHNADCGVVLRLPKIDANRVPLAPLGV